MDAPRFDGVTRTIGTRLTRRTGLGLLAGASIPFLGLAGETDAIKKKKKKKKNKNKNKNNKKAPPTPPKTCPADRPVTCGDGCCPSNFALCCDSISNPNGKSCNPSGDSFRCCGVELGGDACGGPTPKCCPPQLGSVGPSCVSADSTCCSGSQGGGACSVDTPKCCEITPQEPFGSCVGATSTCCGSENGGKSCPQGEFCCPNIFSAPNTQGCCPSVAECCAGDNQCSPPTPNCVDGCCVP